MTVTDPLNHLPALVAPILGVEEAELTDDADFHLDFNATSEDLQLIQTTLENALDISLPDLKSYHPFTYADLKALIEDSII
jgi:acyl carrier protein